MEYIEREKVLEIAKDKYYSDFHKSMADLISLRELLEDTPVAYVAEVRHGEWLYHECVSSYDGAISGYSCSHCGVFVDEEEFENDKFHKKFCGNCGAKMDGKDGE